MEKPRILIVSRSFGVYSEDTMKILEGFASVDGKSVLTEEEMKKIVDCYDALILGNERMDRETLIGARKLRIIARHGIGVDQIDLDAATEKGIVVTYTPQANSDAVAEYAIALMLNIMKSVQRAHEETRKGNWRRFLGFEIMNKTVGIVGFGAIGRSVAKKLSGLEVKILACDPYVSDQDIRTGGATPVSLEELLRSSDVVSLHTALTPETRHLLNRDRIRMMKKGAFLVNTSRGAVIDEETLYEALSKHEIAGAALDVFEVEPVSKTNPLLGLDNVTVSPHMANFTIEALRRMDKMNAEDLERFFRGERPLHVANPKVFEK